MADLALVIHNVRSVHNVGSLMRTADGLGVDRIFLTGYTPYPPQKDDDRPPHTANKVGRAIHKTALGAENSINWQHQPAIEDCLHRLKSEGFKLAALEQSPSSINLKKFKDNKHLALIVGNEVNGLESGVLEQVDYVLEIPMRGQKESLNVAVAGAIAIYQILSV